MRSLAAVIACAVCAVAARADNIDRELDRHGPQLIKALRAKGYTTVGVLKFGLQKGDGPVSYGAGPINANLATRLENALLWYNDKEQPLKVIRGAVGLAGAPPAGGYEADAEARQALFAHDYPLAWEAPPVKADVFLTGTVRLGKDMTTAAVVVRAFDGKTNRADDLLSFTTKTDRTILAESGQSFVVSRRRARDLMTAELKAGTSGELSLAALLDGEAADAARRRDDAPAKGDDAPAGGDDANEYLEFEVRYDDVPQKLTGDPDEGGELRVPTPRPGQKVTFRLRNKLKEDLGLVVMVNGRATLEETRASPEECLRWALPGDNESYLIRGYYDADDNLIPFQVVGVGHDKAAPENAGKLGLIEVFVFLASPEAAGDAESKAARALGRRFRGLSPAQERELGQPRSPEAARRQLVALSKPPKSRDLIVPGEGKTKTTLETRALPAAELVSTPIVIRYYDPAPRK